MSLKGRKLRGFALAFYVIPFFRSSKNFFFISYLGALKKTAFMKENETNSLLAYRRGKRMDDRLLLDEGFEVVEMDGKKYVKVQVYFADRPDNTSADLIASLEAENATLLSELEGYKRSIPRMFNDMRKMIRQNEILNNNLERQRIFHDEKEKDILRNNLERQRIFKEKEEKDMLKGEIESKVKIIARLKVNLQKSSQIVEMKKEEIKSLRTERNSLKREIRKLEKNNKGYEQLLGKIEPEDIPMKFATRYDVMRAAVKKMTKEINALQTEIAVMKLRKDIIVGKAVTNNAESPDSV